jgi:glucose-1-phosphate thymidylyltransferase
MDAGTPDGLLDAALLVKTIEKQHGFKLACLEEIALSKKWVEPDDVARRAMEFKGSDYYDYVLNLIQS